MIMMSMIITASILIALVKKKKIKERGHQVTSLGLLMDSLVAEQL